MTEDREKKLLLIIDRMSRVVRNLAAGPGMEDSFDTMTEVIGAIDALMVEVDPNWRPKTWPKR